MDSVTDAIILIDQDGVISFVNQQVKDLFGYEQDELIGRKIEMLLPELFQHRHVDQRKDYSANPSIRQMGISTDFFACRKDSTEFSCEIGLNPLETADGKFVVCTVHDISKRKYCEDALSENERKLNEQYTELKSIYSTSPVGMCLMDTDLRFLKCNEKLAKINGIPAADHIGRTLREIVPEIADKMESVYHKVIETGEPIIDVEASITAGDDSHKKRVFSACYYPIKSVDGVIQGVSSIVQEITQRKEAEESLQRLHKQLEMRVQERTKELTEANVKLRNEITERKKIGEELHIAEDEASMHRERLAHLIRVQTLGEMATGIAHEINQPLAAIESYAQASQMHLQSGKANPDKVEELLEKISGQAKRAGSVVSRLRTMMQHRTVNPVVVDINSLLSEVTNIAEIDARHHDCRLILKLSSSLPNVIGDEIQIQQVVLNLICNAIDAMADLTDEGEKEVIVETKRKDDKEIEISVTDNGPGISELDAGNIFEAFYTTKDSGMGMGLSICRSIIDAHGGEISYSQNKAGGTTFYFTLPVEKQTG
ncbi:MAG: PAS domain S-box protein [Gammaproteobacteria bacterium]|nr:PAS domain S-box protein [Gammaproteobacteria bacterium]